MQHRQLRNRVARIERRRLQAAFDPYDLRQCFMRSLREIKMPEEEAGKRAVGEIIQAVADGDLLPSEGERLMALVKAKAELTALREIEERLAVLEAASGDGRQP